MRVVLFALLFVPGVAGAQYPTTGTPAGPGEIEGIITTSDTTPLSAVRVTVVELNRSTRSDSTGWYTLRSLPAGLYTVTFARLGVAPQLRRVQVAGTARLDVVLQPSLVELPPVQAVATSRTGGVFVSPQPTTVLEGASLRASHGASVGDALEDLAGVRSLSMSPGIGKPVIRGLTSNRVVVVDDGQRLETQQWGADHAPNTETLGATRIEVLRGPASVLYGSDALGGVVNIVRDPPPDAIGEDPFVRGRLSTGYFSNPAGPEISATMDAASGQVGARVTATSRSSADLRTPATMLHNTGNRAANIDAAASLRLAGTVFTAGFVTRRERIEIYEDPAAVNDFTGYQRIFERRGFLRGSLTSGSDRVEFAATYERNERREFDDVHASHVALGLLARTGTAQLSWDHRPLGPLAGSVGVSLLRSGFDKFGLETLIPGNSSANAAVYVFEQGEFGPWLLSTGWRFDSRSLHADADSVLGMVADRRSWRALTGNIGVLYRVSEPLALVLNIGRGFRAPSAADLFSNGYHEGTRAFERGDPSLGVETSLNVDLAVRARSATVNAELGGFVNRIRDYIYLQPQGSLDTLLHTSGDAVLSGLEALADFAFNPVLSLRVIADYTRGQNSTLGVPLTQIPPARASLRLQAQPPALGSLQRPYVSITGEAHAAQRRLHPGDIGTAGYGLMHFAAGASFTLAGRAATVDLVGRNALNRQYRNFMSAYKTIADAPGRSVRLRLSVDFLGVHKR